MQWLEVGSTVLKAIAYDRFSRSLWIHFHNGRTYQYIDVSRWVVMGLLLSGSKGRYFNTHIRNRYRYMRVIGIEDPEAVPAA